MSLLRTKSIEQSIADTDEPEYKLKKTLSALDLTVFGVGVVIGAGNILRGSPRHLTTIERLHFCHSAACTTRSM